MKTKIVAFALLLGCLAGLSSCGQTTDDTITIYNWEDYIDIGVDDEGEKVTNSVMEDFAEYYFEKTGRTITVNYECFSTNEDMYTQVKNGTIQADLICPSDYMIQKMAAENMLEEFSYVESEDSYANITNYNKYASPYIKALFKKNGFSKYALPYTWGTMGFIYNPNFVKEETVNTWNAQWDSALKSKVTIKDSVRDTYFTAVMHVYKAELDELKSQYEAGSITMEAYNDALTEIFNRCDNETLKKAKQALIDLKGNIYGLEVDDGKNEIVKGTYWVNLAWSGDAVYALDQAEEGDDPTYLKYIIPEEGSNVWFDGWCMPKGAQKDLAEMFVDYLSLPEVAARNMNYTGYTSAIAGDAIWSLVNDWYAAEEGEEVDEVDLSYFFEGTLSEGEAKINIAKSERGRQFDAQYPDEETIARCAIMKDFGPQTDAVYTMWQEFKANL